MKNEPLRLSDKSVREWLLANPRTTPARVCEKYGIDYDLLIKILDGWMDLENKKLVNLAAEICVQNYIKARRNDKDVDILIVAKAVEKLKENLFSPSPLESLRANRILGNVLDEYSQRKINVVQIISNTIINTIKNVAEMDGDVIIDVTPEVAGYENEGETRPLLPCNSDSWIQQNDGLAQENSREMS